MISEMTPSIHEGVRIAALAAIFILASIYVGGRLFPLLISRFARALSDEVLFAIFLGVGLVFAFAATLVGLAAITGAFIVGAVVPYSKVDEKMVHRSFFMKEIFAAVFFAGVIGWTSRRKDRRTKWKATHRVHSRSGNPSRDVAHNCSRGYCYRYDWDWFSPSRWDGSYLSMVLMTPIYSRLIRGCWRALSGCSPLVRVQAS